MRSRKNPARKRHLQDLATLFRSFRDATGLAQPALAARLGVSARTLSNWENEYGLPLPSKRVETLYRMHALDPTFTRRFAEQMLLLEHPAIVLLLASLDGDAKPRATDAVVPPAPPPEVAPPPPPTREELRAELDVVVREVADAVDLRAGDLRRGLQAVLEMLAEKRRSVEQARDALALSMVRKKKG